jgi:hypothetical protein
VLEDSPDLLVLSATMLERLVALREVVAGVRRTHGSELPVVVGGQLVESLPDLSHSLDVELVAGDALETLEFARRIRTVGVPGSARAGSGSGGQAVDPA